MEKVYTIVMIINRAPYPRRVMIVYPYDIRYKLYDVNILDSRCRKDDEATLISGSLSKLTISCEYGIGYGYNIYLDLIDMFKLMLRLIPSQNMFIYCLVKFFILLIHLPTYKYDS